MSSEERTFSTSAVVLFLSSLIILLLNIFKIPANAGPEYNLDKVFYYTLNIMFWLSTPYLLSIIIKKIIWKSEFKNIIGTKSIGKVEDIIIVIIYCISLGVLFLKLFMLEVTFNFIILFLIIMVITVYLRPKLLSMNKTGFIQSARPFKIGDWVSFFNENPDNIIVGKVIGFDGQSIQLKSENNTLLILPKSLILNFVIENYSALENDIQFSVQISLSPRVSIEQAKRILAAATKHALLKCSNTNSNSPGVFITEINKDSIEYKINFCFTPWSPLTPENIKDSILCNVADHLGKAGITFDRDTDHNIIRQVSLFNNLGKNELEELVSSAREILYRAEEIIIKQGDTGSSMFILQEGLLNVFIKANDKGDLKVGVITPGQFFGEMSLFTGETRSATVVAETDSVIFEISKEAMKKILDKKPELINEFGEIIAERQSSNLKIMEDYLNRKESFIQKFVTRIKSFFDLK